MRTYDYIIKRQIKRVGAMNSDFFGDYGFVYAVSNGEITKIGASKKPIDRIKQVARDVGFESFDYFISNPSYDYKKTENQAHKALNELKRENTIYQRECFSCDLSTAKKVIIPLVKDATSGPRMTTDGMIDKIHNAIESGN